MTGVELIAVGLIILQGIIAIPMVICTMWPRRK